MSSSTDSTMSPYSFPPSDTPGMPATVQGARVCAALCTALALVSVVLRFWSRALLPRNVGRRFWFDDLLALSATPFIVASTVVIFHASKQGLGHSIIFIYPTQITSTLRDVFIVQVLFVFAIALPKLSAIALYFRMFETKRKASRVWIILLWLTLALTIAWAIALFLATLLQCRPIATFWDPTIPGYCLNSAQIFIATGVIDAILQIMILLLPVPPLIEMNMERSTKVMVLLLFLVGYV